MSSAKALLGSMLGRFIFRDAQVATVQDPAPRLRRVVLAGPALRGVTWHPGDKLQVFLPAVGTRAYTPLRWDAEAGETELLIYLHGESPGAAWARALRGGEAVQVFGPRRSLSVPEQHAVVLFGDETSLGLLHALALGAPARSITAVLEVASRDDVASVLDGLTPHVTLLARTRDDAHLDAAQAQLAGALAAQPDAQLVMSGRAQAIQTVRRALRAQLRAPAVTKAYWAPGKVGLD